MATEAGAASAEAKEERALIVLDEKSAAVEHAREPAGQSLAIIPRSLREVVALSNSLAKAGAFVPRQYQDKPEEIGACIMMGLEMGVPPMRSLRQIHVIDGKPEAGAELMLDRMIQAGVRHEWLETTTTVARLRLTRNGFAPYTHQFTIEDARRAGLAEKQNWKKYTAAMLRHRCVSEAKRAFCPDVMAGVYAPGEIGGPEIVGPLEPTPPTAATREDPPPRQQQQRAKSAPAKAAPADEPADLEGQVESCRAKKLELGRVLLAEQKRLGWSDAEVFELLGRPSFLSEIAMTEIEQAIETMRAVEASL